MTLTRLDLIRSLAFALPFIFPVTSGAAEHAPIAAQIAQAYGVDSFGRVQAIRYTFNIPAFKLSRTWVWEPETDTVTYDGPGKDGKPLKVTYRRDELDSQSDAIKKDVDPAFVNDHYVLLFPFHVEWDDWATVTDEGIHEMPISKKPARRVIVQYPSEGGYSPGDTWELYVGKNKRIREFIFHRHGDAFPKLYTATWGGVKKAGPIFVATDHQGTGDGKPLPVTLTDVAVKVKGSDSWVDAK